MAVIQGTMTDLGLQAFREHRDNETRLDFAALVLGNGKPGDPTGWARVEPSQTQTKLVNEIARIPVTGWQVLSDQVTTVVRTQKPAGLVGMPTEAGLVDSQNRLLCVASISLIEMIDEPGLFLTWDFVLKILAAKTCIGESPNPLTVTWDEFIQYAKGGGVKEIIRGNHTTNWLGSSGHTLTVPLGRVVDPAKSTLRVTYGKWGGGTGTLPWTDSFASEFNEAGDSILIHRSPSTLSSIAYNNLLILWEITVYGSTILEEPA